MSQDEGYRVATGPKDYVTVKTAEDAVKLGRAFANLIADIGVYKAERDRLALEAKRLRKAGDAMADYIYPDLNDGYDDIAVKILKAWAAAKEGRDAK